jgi:hypothetical protein
MLKQIKFSPGVNREGTGYSAAGGWWETQWVRFRQGLPEKIGGWQRLSTETYLGVCRSLTQWALLSGEVYTGVGTNLKYYIEAGGLYFDITPIRSTVTLNNPFDTTNTSTTVTVHDTAHGANDGDFVTFSGAAAVGGLDLNDEYQLTYVDADTYTITAASAATSTVTGGGGATVSAAYQINVGAATEVPTSGWGSGGWGSGTWGTSSASTTAIRVWNADNFGQSLVFGPRGGAPYYWDASGSLATRGVLVSSLGGASDVPLTQNLILVSDVNRFTLLFGTNPYGSVDQDPMVIRWADQESVTDWTPGVDSQAGDLRLSRGSMIVAVVQTRQEVLVLTDAAAYSLQYVGPPGFWGATLLADNVSIMGSRCAAFASGTVYWMGSGKFYKYNGSVETLDCSLRRHIFDDINTSAGETAFAGVVEAFNEVWWFYCSDGSTDVDSYVVYNYMDNGWYYGSLRRSAWVDSGLGPNPIAADYDNDNLVYHEVGVDNDSTGTPVAIEAYITSAEIDIGENHNFGFVWRVLPDITFTGSTGGLTPQVTMTLIPLKNSGSGYTDPASVGGSNSGTVARIATSPVEEFTGQINTRVRGRQLIFKVSSNRIGTKWQMGVPRLDVRPDGAR